MRSPDACLWRQVNAGFPPTAPFRSASCPGKPRISRAKVKLAKGGSSPNSRLLADIGKCLRLLAGALRQEHVRDCKNPLSVSI